MSKKGRRRARGAEQRFLPGTRQEIRGGLTEMLEREREAKRNDGRTMVNQALDPTLAQLGQPADDGG